MWVNINSRILKKRFCFIPQGFNIFLQIDDSNWCQPCYGGGFCGTTLTYNGTQKNLDKICRNWYKNYLKFARETP